MKKKPSLNARSLRVLLIAALILLLFGVGAGFYYTQNLLREFAKDTVALNSKAAAGEQDLSALKQIQTYLATHQTALSNVKQVTTDGAQYNYQDKIVSDISSFAKQSNVTVTSYTFSGNDSSTQPTSPTPTPTPATTPQAVVGTKTATVNVAIRSPVNYANLLNFIHHIEQNITKMQIASVTLAHDASTGKNQVSTQAFDIEVYIR